MGTLFEFMSEPFNLVYSTMVGIAVGWWLITVASALLFGSIEGVFEVDSDVDIDVDADVDADLDLDADADVNGGSFFGSGFANSLFGFIGVGKVPATVVVSMVVFMVGVAGLLLNALLAAVGVPVDGLAAILMTAPLALLGGTVAAGYTLKPLHALAPEEKPLAKSTDIVGLTGVVVTGRVDEGFGQVRVRSESGDDITVSARSLDGRKFEYGQKVYVSEHQADKNLYFVTEAVGD